MATDTNANSCNYFFLTGRSRIAQLPPDQRDPAVCPLYIPRSGETVKQNRRMSSHVWEPLAEKLYKEGKSDPQIAAVLGVKPHNIAAWRYRRGFKRTQQSYDRPRTFDTEKAMRLYKAGKNDKEISEAVGISRQIIGLWRKEHGLPTVPGIHTHTARPCTFDWDEALRLYEKGCTDNQIAANLGCSPKSVSKWRRKNCLPRKTERR